MRFVVERTSMSWNQKPCDEAVPGTFNEFCGPARDLKSQQEERQGWFVDLDTQADLIAFIKRHGSVVIMEHLFSVDDLMVIEVYDAYRE